MSNHDHAPLVLEIDGRHLAFGLPWRTFEKSPSNSEIAEGNPALGTKVRICKLTANSGLGIAVAYAASRTEEKGVIPDTAIGNLSAMAGLVAQVAPSAIVMLEIKPGSEDSEALWWGCAIRDGLILEGSDRIGSVEEVREVLASFVPYGKWDVALGDHTELQVEFGLPLIRPKTLRELLDLTKDVKAPFKLLRNGGIGLPSSKKLLAGIAILGLMAWLWWPKPEVQTRKPEVAPTLIEKVNDLVEADDGMAEKREHMAKRLETGCDAFLNQPKPVEWTHKIYAVTANLSLRVAQGWNLTGMECKANAIGPGHCTLAWKILANDLASVTNRDLLQQAGHYGDISFALNGVSASQRIPLPSSSQSVKPKKKDVTPDEVDSLQPEWKERCVFASREQFSTQTIPALQALRTTKLVSWEIENPVPFAPDANTLGFTGFSIGSWRMTGKDWWTLPEACQRLTSDHFRVSDLVMTITPKLEVTWTLRGKYGVL